MKESLHSGALHYPRLKFKVITRPSYGLAVHDCGGKNHSPIKHQLELLSTVLICPIIFIRCTTKDVISPNRFSWKQLWSGMISVQRVRPQAAGGKPICTAHACQRLGDPRFALSRHWSRESLFENLTLSARGPSLYVRIWRIKTIPALKEFKYF